MRDQAKYCEICACEIENCTDDDDTVFRKRFNDESPAITLTIRVEIGDDHRPLCMDCVKELIGEYVRRSRS